MTKVKTITKLANGDNLEIIDAPGSGLTPIVFLNGVVQNPADYYVTGTGGIVFHNRELDIEWKQHRLLFPRRINGRWYWPGNVVYRYFVLSPGGGFWKYGDEFDMLRNT